MVRPQHLNRPEHCPRGHEWLPDAFRRDIEPHGPGARERARQALAEGDVEALLRTPLGDRYPIDARMWDKEPVARKVYPRFRDGWMRMGVHPDGGPYVEGWIFVPKGALTQALAETAARESVKTRRYSKATLRRWYESHIAECQKAGLTSSCNEDLAAARRALGDGVPREAVRILRRELAPLEWRQPGPKRSRGKDLAAGLRD